eukprot:324269_1
MFGFGQKTTVSAPIRTCDVTQALSSKGYSVQNLPGSKATLAVGGSLKLPCLNPDVQSPITVKCVEFTKNVKDGEMFPNAVVSSTCPPSKKCGDVKTAFTRQLPDLDIHSCPESQVLIPSGDPGYTFACRGGNISAVCTPKQTKLADGTIGRYSAWEFEGAEQCLNQSELSMFLAQNFWFILAGAGALVCLFSLICLVCCLTKRRRNKSKQKNGVKQYQEDYSPGDPAPPPPPRHPASCDDSDPSTNDDPSRFGRSNGGQKPTVRVQQAPKFIPKPPAGRPKPPPGPSSGQIPKSAPASQHRLSIVQEEDYGVEPTAEIQWSDPHDLGMDSHIIDVYPEPDPVNLEQDSCIPESDYNFQEPDSVIPESDYKFEESDPTVIETKSTDHTSLVERLAMFDKPANERPALNRAQSADTWTSPSLASNAVDFQVLRSSLKPTGLRSKLLEKEIEIAPESEPVVRMEIRKPTHRRVHSTPNPHQFLPPTTQE